MRFTRGLLSIMLLGFVWAAVDASEPLPFHDHSLESFVEPYRKLDLAAAEPGRIAAIHVKRGAAVKAGELLVELDANLLQASRRVAEQRAQSTAKREALVIEAARKTRRLEALKSLRRGGVGTPEELSEAESEAKVAELRVQEAEEELERARLAIEELDAQIEQRRIRAKIDGVVAEIHREEGEFVSVADPKLVTLVDLRRLRVTCFVDTNVALELREGQAASIELIDSGVRVTGVMEYVAPLTQADSGRVRVDVVLENEGRRIRSGVRCRMVVPGSVSRASNTRSSP